MMKLTQRLHCYRTKNKHDANDEKKKTMCIFCLPIPYFDNSQTHHTSASAANRDYCQGSDHVTRLLHGLSLNYSEVMYWPKAPCERTYHMSHSCHGETEESGSYTSTSGLQWSGAATSRRLSVSQSPHTPSQTLSLTCSTMACLSALPLKCLCCHIRTWWLLICHKWLPYEVRKPNTIYGLTPVAEIFQTCDCNLKQGEKLDGGLHSSESFKSLHSLWTLLKTCVHLLVTSCLPWRQTNKPESHFHQEFPVLHKEQTGSLSWENYVILICWLKKLQRLLPCIRLHLS